MREDTVDVHPLYCPPPQLKKHDHSEVDVNNNSSNPTFFTTKSCCPLWCWYTICLQLRIICAKLVFFCLLLLQSFDFVPWVTLSIHQVAVQQCAKLCHKMTLWYYQLGGYCLCALHLYSALYGTHTHIHTHTHTHVRARIQIARYCVWVQLAKKARLELTVVFPNLDQYLRSMTKIYAATFISMCLITVNKVQRGK